MTAAQLLVIVGGGIYALMGAGHALLSLSDVWRPRAFAPVDPTVIDDMSRTGVRFAQGRASMWDAWLGFNISHGQGVLIFGLAAMFAGQYASGSLLSHPATFPLLLLFSLSYVAMAARFWFWAPLAGTIVNTACFIAAWAVA